MTISTDGTREELLKINSSALANLLVKLVHTGGTELAKVMMHYYGETTGRLMAKYVKDRMNPKNESEWISYYPAVHAFLGQGNFTLTKIYLDKDDDYYQLQGTLEKSPLALFYQERFGTSTEPVDWLERGYITGYSNEILKTVMLFKEIQCIAKGDLLCEFIGKSKNNLTT